MVTKTCRTCQATFSYEPILRPDGSERFPIAACEPCIERSRAEEDAHASEQIRLRRQERWAAICPPLYRTTDQARIPVPFRNAITSWSYSPRGVGFIGATGQCKTRSAYALLRRHHEQGRSCEAVSTTTFAALCLRQFSDDREARQHASVALSRIRHVDLLLIDDLGKCKMTERCEVEFFRPPRAPHLPSPPHPLDRQRPRQRTSRPHVPRPRRTHPKKTRGVFGDRDGVSSITRVYSSSHSVHTRASET